MAQYDLTPDDIKSNFADSAVSDELKSAIDAVLDNASSSDDTGATEAQVLSFGAGDTLPTLAEGEVIDVAVIDPAADLAQDIAASIMVFQGAADLTMTQEIERVVVGSDSADTFTVEASAAATIEAGAGDDTVTGGAGTDSISGGAGDDSIDAGVGSDSIEIGLGADTVDGGSGFDVVTVTGSAADFDVEVVNGVLVMTSTSTGEISSVNNSEYVQFDDGSVVISAADQVDAQIARLYEAFFNRAADANGLDAWQTYAETNGAANVAQQFMQSEEFTATSSSLDNTQFVEQIYSGALDRAADTSGLTAWVDYLDRGVMDRAEFVTAVTGSTEAQTTIDYIHTIDGLI